MSLKSKHWKKTDTVLSNLDLAKEKKNIQHYLKWGISKNRVLLQKKKVAEFRDFQGEKKAGDVVTLDIFTEGEYVDVVGTSKGKGFQGVVKRHGFSGVGGATHGQHDRSRAGGSMGASSFPSHVFKGKRMPGRMGGDRVKARNLEVMRLIKDKNILVVKGSVPGASGSFVIIQK